ncbi:MULTISPECIES: hypothetical protein [Thermus]|nr:MULTISPECIES: hypothetical protein [Thermus]KHG65014.1 hypothetical protein QT17_09000 [Thermus sp. 2.9]
MRLSFLILATLLAACSYTFTVDLGSTSLNLDGLPPTSPFGEPYVVYPKTPITLNPPPLDVVRALWVQGVARANLPLNARVLVYARAQEPGSECYATNQFVLCPASKAGERVGTLDFGGQSEIPFTLTGDTLLQGLRQGRLWLGVALEGSVPPGLGEIRLEEMKAHVTVGL